MTRYAWMTASLLAIATPTLAQSQQLTGTAKWADSASREIDAANAAGDLNRLTTAAAMLDRVLTVTPNDPLLLYYRAFALYRTSTIYTGMKKNDEAKRALDEADMLLEQATAKSPTAEALALRSAVMGLMIGASGNPLSGMTLGPKAGGLLDRAKEMEPKNPRVWLISGMSAMFTPKMFGGGTDKAEQELRRRLRCSRLTGRPRRRRRGDVPTRSSGWARRCRRTRRSTRRARRIRKRSSCSPATSGCSACCCRRSTEPQRSS
ncbi:MAG TPA: hypothetical protein VM076_10400 [Gemmatimonadaceae bacterium]|nr:hypothetical protein [Gemmatimonadaceae bacterium]